MTHRLRAIAIGIVLGTGVASGQPVAGPEAGASSGAVGAGTPLSLPAAFDRIEKALPPGWTMLATGAELVFRHDKPCYVAAVRHAAAGTGAPAAKPAAPAGGGPMVTVELRYRLEPRWSAAQLATAKAIDHKVTGDLHALSDKYRIDAIHQIKGKPMPVNPDERARLDAYDSEHAKVAKRLVALPHCTTGDVAVFDGEDTYAQLALELDPPEVITEAHKVIALLGQYCR